ncbi:hypothetical protein GCM10023166_26090 [Paeniglutamicibacter cryotolerans]
MSLAGPSARGILLGAVVCLGLALQPFAAGRIRYRFGLWETGWAAVLRIVGNVCASIATALALAGLFRRSPPVRLRGQQGDGRPG